MDQNNSNSILDKIISEQQVSSLQDFRPQDTLKHLLELLGERERQVVERRFGLLGQTGETLEKIGQGFQVTRERIRQIERLAIKKLRTLPTAVNLLQKTRQLVVEVLEAEGGVAPSQRLEKVLSHEDNAINCSAVKFILDEILDDLVVKVGGDNGTYVEGWRLRSASLDTLRQLIEKAQDIVSQNDKPMTDAELGNLLLQAGLNNPLGQPLQDVKQVLSLLEISNQIKKNSFNEWGLAHWETITPKRMNDKIYLVLKKSGKPLHFKQIVNLINQQGFDHKKAYAPTVHNELILDKKYVLVGRGIYGLREWGYEPGVVADVLAKILSDRGTPMKADELIAEVLKQRFVKKGTIQLALANRQKFTRSSDGRYTLAQVASN